MLLKLLALGGLGYFGYRHFGKTRSRAAFAANQGNATIRDAGPEAMRDQPDGAWTRTDEASDESFPASDPPATY